MIIHLIRISPNARRIFIRRGATIPEDFIRPAALPLFCLAPHGVFRASRIAPRAVSSYLAFSTLPALFSKNRRCVFCDTFPSTSAFANVARVFYAACCRMVFGLSSSESRHAGLTSDHLPSERSISQSRKQESRRGRYLLLRFRKSFSRVPVFLIKMSSEWRRNRDEENRN